MLARAIEAAGEGGVEGDLANAPVSFRDALAFINRKRKAQAPQPIRPLDPEAARAEILDMVLAIKRGREKFPVRQTERPGEPRAAAVMTLT